MICLNLQTIVKVLSVFFINTFLYRHTLYEVVRSE